MTDLDRRGFLGGLLGVTVIAALPLEMVVDGNLADVSPVRVPVFDFKLMQSIQAPDGWTYNWVRSALLGEPDPLNVQRRIDAGWTFVEPSAHPELPSVTAENAISGLGLILMQKQTALIDLPKPHPLPDDMSVRRMSIAEDGVH